MIDTAAKIKGRIVEKGLTHEYVAKKAGIDRSTLFRKLKNGGDTLTVRELRKIAIMLSFTPEEVSAFILSE